jgi:hypothetical protein
MERYAHLRVTRPVRPAPRPRSGGRRNGPFPRPPRPRAGPSWRTKSASPRILTNNPRRPAQTAGNTPIRTAGTETACAQLDPFCTASLGTKVAGSPGAPSAPIRERAILTVTADSSGNAGVILTNCPAYGYFVPTMQAGALFPASISPTSFSPYTLYNSLGGTNATGQLRVVNWGFRVNFIGSDYNNQGSKTMHRMSAATINDVCTALQGSGVGAATYSPQYSLTRMPQPVTCIGFPESEMQRQSFVDISPNNASNDSSLPWGEAFVIIVSGAQASANVLTIDVVMNYEIQQQYTGSNALSLFSKVQSPRAGPNEFYSQLASLSRQFMSAFYPDLSYEQVAAEIARAAGRALRLAIMPTPARLIQLAASATM